MNEKFSQGSHARCRAPTAPTKIFALPDDLRTEPDVFSGPAAGGLHQANWSARISTGSRRSQKRSTGRSRTGTRLRRRPTRTYTALSTTAQGETEGHDRTERKGEEAITHVTLENPSKSLAFFVRLKVNKGKGDEILPVLWQDNYISLLPGEKREISATYRASELGAATASVEVSGLERGVIFNLRL